MKKSVLVFLSFVALCIIFQACNNSKTYAEMQEDERKAIRSFISDSAINVISFAQFEAQDSTTDVTKNEYVQLPEGVYMQIVDKGNGTKFANGNRILVRFWEMNVMDRYIYSYNTTLSNVDEFVLTKTSSYMSGTFDQSSYFASYHGETAVPNGWLLPLNYVTDFAHVKIIVPHKVGSTYSQTYVYPFFYEITKYQIW